MKTAVRDKAVRDENISPFRAGHTGTLIRFRTNIPNLAFTKKTVVNSVMDNLKFFFVILVIFSLSLSTFAGSRPSSETTAPRSCHRKQLNRGPAVCEPERGEGQRLFRERDAG